jgi:hypothetical protein
MVVKGRDLVDLGRRQAHFMSQRHQVYGRQVAVLVLDFVQVFDQQVALARRFTEQLLDFEKRIQVDYPPLGLAALSLLAFVDSLGFHFRL